MVVTRRRAVAAMWYPVGRTARRVATARAAAAPTRSAAPVVAQAYAPAATVQAVNGEIPATIPVQALNLG